ncbi:MAG: DUF3791 domain-containing protein [Prevotella sp.]|jgi:hypothetical protein|nr:DUF3791 domain-containing protein [Prevotella sp.]
MEKSLEKMMFPFKVQQLLYTIIEKKGLGVEDALQYLYSSELYEQLSSESSYLWQLSTLNLYDLLKKEKRLKKQNQNNTASILLFLIFCLENYKDYKNIGAKETLFLFNKYNVLDYLEEVYETLHTQSKEYIMSEIDNYIKNRKV